MSESLSFASEKSGLPPGSLVHVGEVHMHEHKISVVNYNKSTLKKHTVKSIEELLPYKTSDTITWVIVDGLKDVSIIDAIGQHFVIYTHWCWKTFLTPISGLNSKNLMIICI
jgi:magnesium transporter